MTETEQLKKNTEDAYHKQRIKELNLYIEKLSTRIDECLKKDRDSWYVYLVCWLAWVVLGFFNNELLDTLGIILFFGGWAWTGYHGRNLSRAFGEFRGAMKVLEILGMIPPFDEDGAKKKKRKVMSEFVEMVKGWGTKKAEMQGKAYAPA